MSIRALRNSDAKKYQSVSVRDQQRLADLDKEIASISKLRDQHGADTTDQKREIARLRRVMADFHSQNARLQSLAQGREHAGDSTIAGRDLAIVDRDNLRANLAQLASGGLFAVASPLVSSNSKRLRSDSNSGRSSKRSRASGNFSPFTPAKIINRFVSSKMSSGSAVSAPVTRSADTVQTYASKPQNQTSQSGKLASNTKSTKPNIPRDQLRPLYRSSRLQRMIPKSQLDHIGQSTLSDLLPPHRREHSHDRLFSSIRLSQSDHPNPSGRLTSSVRSNNLGRYRPSVHPGYASRTLRTVLRVRVFRRPPIGRRQVVDQASPENWFSSTSTMRDSSNSP